MQLSKRSTMSSADKTSPIQLTIATSTALAGSADARWHVERIMLAVNYAVEHVQDHERLSNKFVPLSDLAIKHGVTNPQYFKFLGETILKEVEKRNGGLSPEAVSGCEKLLSIVCIMLTSKFSVSSSLC
uniref:Globin domain-containing protein n=1 Tax=Eptatretus burgeri TaxID=7764 RepID=A0A8C4N4T2_EPTBU